MRAAAPDLNRRRHKGESLAVYWARQSRKARTAKILSRAGLVYEDHCGVCWFGRPIGSLKVESSEGKVHVQICRACTLRVIDRAEMLIERGKPEQRAI